jgi:MFS superfamily sulfate permease-like transporter
MKLPKRVFPFLEWFDGYSASALRVDFVSGLTVALVLVPQSMAYAQLAGLPPYYGLYAAFLPPMVANLFGSSRQLATGPVAMVSLMTAATLEPLATAGSTEYIQFAILLALMVGLFQFLLGVLRLGLVVNFLSHPVVNGFTNAGALIIATSQLSKIFGVSVDNAEHHYQTVYRVIVEAIRFTHLPTLGMAVIAFVTMIGLRRINPRIPNVLAAVVVTTVLSWAIGFEKNLTTSLAQIDSERVVSLVESFNRVVEQREKLESLRMDGNTTLSEIASADREFCTGCHEPRDLDRFEATRERPDDSGIARRSLALHQMAGLVNNQIENLKESGSHLRAEIRTLQFERVDRGNGAIVFRLRGEGTDTGTDGERWRLRVGNGQLDPDRLVMVGGGAVVSTIPAGLPDIRLPGVDLKVAPKLIAASIIISLVGFMEAISVAKAMAAKTRQRLDPNQELIGQGLANIVGCMGQSYAVSGSFSRSAVNLQAGAQTGLSNVFSSGVVMIVLLFFSQWLYHLPQAVLAAIIMMAVFGLLNVSGFAHAWRTHRFDGFVSVVAFAVTLLLAPHIEWGLFLGVALSLGGYMFRTMRPKVAALSPHPSGALRDAVRHELPTCRYIAVVSFAGPLNFASTTYLEDEMLQRVSELPDLRHLLISGEGMIEIDASGEETLRHLVERLRAAGYEVSFCGLKDEVLDVLRRSHLLERIGEEHIYPTQAQAIAAIYTNAHREVDESECPFRTVMPRITELSLHPDGSLRDAGRWGLDLCQRIAALRFDDPLSFANTAFLEHEILNMVASRSELRHVIFVSHGISSIDTAGAEKLAWLVEHLRAQGFAVSFTGLKEDVWDVLERTGALDAIGRESCFPTQLMAVAAVYAGAHADGEEQDCPLRSLAPALTELSRHPDGSLRSAERHHLARCRYLAAFRFEGSLNFTTIPFFEEELERRLDSRPELRHVLIVAPNLDGIDVAAANGLSRVTDRLRERGITVSFSGLSDNVMEVLEQTGAIERIGRASIYPNHVRALEIIGPLAHQGSDEPRCPLEEAVPADPRDQ